MTVASLLATTALLVAAAALVRTRRTARRLERLTESYWELRYEYGQLRSRMDRADPAEPAAEAAAAPKSGSATQSFVPLSSLKSRP